MTIDLSILRWVVHTEIFHSQGTLFLQEQHLSVSVPEMSVCMLDEDLQHSIVPKGFPGSNGQLDHHVLPKQARKYCVMVLVRKPVRERSWFCPTKHFTTILYLAFKENTVVD